MKNLAKLLCFVILLTIPSALFAQFDRDGGYYYDDGPGVVGKIIAKDKKNQTLEIYDRSHRHYTVLCKGALIYEGEKKRNINDIDVGDIVRIEGRENGRSVLEARVIYGYGKEQPLDERLGNVRLYGTIRQVDVKGRKIELSTDGKTQKIRTLPETDIVGATGRRIDIGGLKKGDAVSIQGYRTRSNEIVAESIRMGGYGWDDRGWSNGRYDSFEGRVVRKTSWLSRKIRVEPTGWNPRLGESIEIDVPKDAQVRRMGRTISVHDIKAGEIVYVEGTWSKSTFVPVRIEVGGGGIGRDYDRRDYRSIQGTIKQIDYRKREFVIDTGAGDRRVYCDRAKIWYGGRERDFEDLKRGDRVWIEGKVTDKAVDAERIEVGAPPRL